MTAKSKPPKARKLSVRKQTIKDLVPKAGKSGGVKGGNDPNISKDSYYCNAGVC